MTACYSRFKPADLKEKFYLNFALFESEKEASAGLLTAFLHGKELHMLV